MTQHVRIYGAAQGGFTGCRDYTLYGSRRESVALRLIADHTLYIRQVGQ